MPTCQKVHTMTITGLDHVALPTQNPTAMMEFYGALGFTIPDERFWRRAPNPRLVIQCGEQRISSTSK